MEVSVLLWALTLLSATASVVPEPHYMMVVPAILSHPSEEKVCILLSSLPESVHLTVTLEMMAQNHSIVEKDVAKPGTFECISFQVPAFTPTGNTEEEEEVAHVHILVRKGDSVSFEGRKKVLVKDVFIRDIIQTDKPFYKPGETVRFRIVKLDNKLKALQETIPLIQLTDPNENRIGQWLDVETQQGIADFSFPLASEAAEGMYTIKVGDGIPPRGETYFAVGEYELPKFEVLFDLPPFVTLTDEEFLVKVCGKYTYGKPVHGKVDLTVRRTTAYYMLMTGDYAEIEKEYTGQTDRYGCVSFIIHGADINMTEAGFGSYISLSAEFVDEETGATNKADENLSLYSKEVSINFVNLNPFYKQGFPYTGKMSVSTGQTPVQNETVYITVEVNDVETHHPYVSDENGSVHFSLDTTNWNNTLVSIRGRHSIEKLNFSDPRASLTIHLQSFNWLKPFYSESNSFLEIQHVEEELSCGKDQEVLVDYIIDRRELGPEDDHVDFYYLVVSKGKIVSSGQKEVPVGQDETLKGTFTLTLSVNMDLAPTARLLLYAVFADGEVAADVDVFSIEKCLRHQVSVGFSKEEGLPGSEVSLQVDAAPGALCSVKALDKSVILMNEEKTSIQLKELFKVGFYYREDTISGRGFDYRLEDFEPYPCLLRPGQSHRRKRSLKVAPWYQNEADVYSLFKFLRMKILTNTRIKKPVSCELQHERILFGSARVLNAPLPAANVERVSQDLDSKPKKGKEMSKPRTYFPETWIWDLVPVNEEGKASRSFTAPDTITEWRADAFCVADIGFGLAQPASFRVFQPFFVDLLMPYSVVRGETFELKATVFNYLKECIQVTVRLAESQQVDVKACPTCRFSVCLCAEEAHTFSWNVTATQLGRINLSVTTEAEETQELCGNRIAMMPAHGHSDTVIKPLLVKPEGVFKEETHNAFLCSSGDAMVEEVSLKLPENVVEDSGRAAFSVIGDILGPSLEHLDQLLEMPFGCGEQNMVKFVPNIFILRYLEATNQATPEITAKAMEYMKKGYQRQLLYQHSNGSYSAFGKRDAEGNTWLTAFVARAFGQAKSHIFIDEKHIQDTVHWLEEHQHPSGCFESVGRLFNNALKGGVDDEFSLTAYVTAALLEVHLDQNNTMVEDALACLKRNLSFVEDAYPRALLAYVFTLAGDMETRQELLRNLTEQEAGEDAAWFNTETFAYILLAHLSKPEVSADDIKEASRIVPILVTSQNSYGGFFSTQDTVVALQALSRYAALTYRETEDVQVLVKSSTGFQHEFHVDKGNRLVLQQASLPEVPGQYKVEVSGNGCAYVQSTLRYNQQPEKYDAFTLSVETLPKECSWSTRKHFDIHLRVSYTGKRERSNMVLLEVNMLSGYIPMKKTVKGLLEKPLVKKVEFDPDKVSVYLDELDSDEQHYSFSVEQEFDVKDLKPVTVKVYDYYQPDDFAVAEYNAPCSTESTKEDHAHPVAGV